MTAAQILAQLRVKHAEDVFVPECKNGPSGATFYRIDAWVMQKSWSHPTTFGYEIKVSRRDFLADDKWQNYLPLCSDFYFVCPSGLIQPEEIAAPAGLIWSSNEGSRLYVKKKAQRRTTEIPESLWRYLVMRLGSGAAPDEAADWRAWLESKSEDLRLGRRCGKRLHEVVSKQVHLKETENIRLQKELEKLGDVRAFLDRAGIDVHSSWDLVAALERRKRELQQALPEDFVYNLKSAHNALGRLLEQAKGST